MGSTSALDASTSFEPPAGGLELESSTAPVVAARLLQTGNLEDAKRLAQLDHTITVRRRVAFVAAYVGITSIHMHGSFL